LEPYEYLEQITADIRSNGRARAVREELAAHLLQLQNDLVADGMEDAQAWTEAMRRLGPPDLLREALAADTASAPSRAQYLLQGGAAAIGIVASLAALAGWQWGWMLAIAVSCAGFMAILHGQNSWRTAGGPLVTLFGRHRWLILAAAGWGAWMGAEPVWMAGVYDPWHLGSSLPLLIAAGLAVSSAVLILRAVWLEPGQVWAAAAFSGFGVVAAGIVAVVLLSRAYPIPPSPAVDWYNGLLMTFANGTAHRQFVAWWQMNQLLPVAQVAAGWYIGSVGAGVLASVARLWHRAYLEAPWRSTAG
jgi:hypothetical protein